MQHDIIVIGSGLGGLLTAVLLAKEGYNVAVVEQNKQIGGCLQTFSFDKKVFESAVHYIGSLETGQVQNKIFTYAGIQQQLKLKQLDQDCFDLNIFGDEAPAFAIPQGIEHFSQRLKEYFPVENNAIDQYIRQLKHTCGVFPLYNLKNGDQREKERILPLKLSSVLENCQAGKQLQNVICGNGILYAGQEDKTPFYTHALVSNSYFNSAWKCEEGSSQISKLLWQQLQKFGGTIYRHEKINVLQVAHGSITKAVSDSGREFIGKYFISNVHPQKTMEMLSGMQALKPVYMKRVSGLENTIGCLMINIVLKPGIVKYRNYNINWNQGASLQSISNVHRIFPTAYSLYFHEDKALSGFADTVSVLSYIDISLFDKWTETFNTSLHSNERCSDYESFKAEKALQILDKIAERYPEIKNNIHSLKIATPLSFRDYQGSATGSMYGILKDANHLHKSNIPTHTKIPNLFLTGQNINLHGILGVSITAIASAANFIGLDYLLEKINKAY